ncbi:hypothetical protein EK904_002776 [Melospiza melodia maxima]|nr:hypothetical protein EK904_002776 [Melospiza melodia maxima]
MLRRGILRKQQGHCTWVSPQEHFHFPQKFLKIKNNVSLIFLKGNVSTCEEALLVSHSTAGQRKDPEPQTLFRAAWMGWSQFTGVWREAETMNLSAFLLSWCGWGSAAHISHGSSSSLTLVCAHAQRKPSLTFLFLWHVAMKDWFSGTQGATVFRGKKRTDFTFYKDIFSLGHVLYVLPEDVWVFHGSHLDRKGVLCCLYLLLKMG